MGWFETDTLALPGNRAALADLNGQWVDRFHDRNGLKYIVLDMDRSVSPTHGDQEGAAWNGHFDCGCYHRLFLFNQFGMLERCALVTGTRNHHPDGPKADDALTVQLNQLVKLRRNENPEPMPRTDQLTSNRLYWTAVSQRGST